MKIFPNATLVLTLILSVNIVLAQEADSSRYDLTKASAERIARYAVWRTDFYICTGIAYSKSVGKTTDDFMRFVAETHVKTLNSLKGQGIEPIVNLMNFVITNYPDGTFEIISESPTRVKARANRPYIRYFNSGYMVDVTVDEFEMCLWGHLKLMLKSLGIELNYKVVEDHMECEISLLE
jgi:hypothetical protein